MDFFWRPKEMLESLEQTGGSLASKVLGGFGDILSLENILEATASVMKGDNDTEDTRPSDPDEIAEGISAEQEDNEASNIATATLESKDMGRTNIHQVSDCKLTYCEGAEQNLALEEHQDISHFQNLEQLLTEAKVVTLEDNNPDLIKEGVTIQFDHLGPLLEEQEYVISTNESINPIPSSLPQFEVKRDNGVEDLTGFANRLENEAASPNANQAPVSREEREEQTEPCTDCPPQETTSEPLSPSGSILLHKSQEPESDPTNKSHKAPQSQDEEATAITGQEVTSMDTLKAEEQQTNGKTEAPQETETSAEPTNISQNDSDEKEEDNKKKEEEDTEEEEEEEEEMIEGEEDRLGELDPESFPSVRMTVQEYEKEDNQQQRRLPALCRYNTVNYRKIKRGNTKQRIDEFESVLDV